MALSKSQRVANDKYIQKNYDRLPLSYHFLLHCPDGCAFMDSGK